MRHSSNADASKQAQGHATTGPVSSSRPVELRSRFTPGNSIAMVVVVVCLASLLISVARNSNFQWPVVFHYFLYTSILGGLLTTIELTVLVVAVGLLLGIGIALLYI